MDNSASDDRWTLMNLPLAARLCLAAFLISVGLGYLSALANLHFQEATPGNLLPDDEDVVNAYHGKSKKSQFERLITAHPSLPFNGDGSMRRVFEKPRVKLTTRAKTEVAGRLKEELKLANLDPNDPRVEKRFFDEVDNERIALVAWSRLESMEAKKAAFEKDAFTLPGKLAELPLNPAVAEGKEVRIKSIIEARCTGCHSSNAGGNAGRFPLEEWDDIVVYTNPETKGKSLSKLALTTHVHLLGFSMLYGLTGLILALTPWTAYIRVPLAPLALLAQVVDISFWWLARLPEPEGPMFAKGIMVTGGIVAVALVFQIVLSLFGMFRWTGRAVVFILLIAAAGGGFGLKQKILDPHLAKEKESMRAVDKPAE